MTRLAFRGLIARPLRTALTLVAVVLAVAMVCAALIVADTMGVAAHDLSVDAYRGSDAVVAAPRAFGPGDVFGTEPALPSAVLSRVRSTPGVGTAAADVLGQAKLATPSGRLIGDGPFFGAGVDPGDPAGLRLSPFTLKQGRWATRAGEVVVDAATLAREGLRIGGPVRVTTTGAARRYRIVGAARMASVDSLGAGTLAVFDLATAQRVLGHPGRYSDVLVKAAAGVGAAALRHRLAGALGPQVHVTTAQAQDRFSFHKLQSGVGFIRIGLLVFAGIAILVAAFTIANTQSIIIAHRTRELALLRAQGASPGQVRCLVLAEAAVLGVAGAGLGVLTGIGLAKGLTPGLSASGLQLPEVPTVIADRTIVVSALVGIVFMLVSALVPALKASRVAPIQALREAGPGRGAAASRRGPVAGAVLGLLGLAIIGVALFAGGLELTARFAAMAPGCLAVLAGVALLAPRAVVPLASVIGRPGERIGGVAGELARRNAMRNPGRTAATAAALMIGVALVTFVTALGSGLKRSITGSLSERITATHVLAAPDGSSPLVPAAEDAVRHVRGVRATSAIRLDRGRAFGTVLGVTAVDPATIGAVWHFDWHQGSAAAVRSLDAGGAIVRADVARRFHLALGDRFALTAQDGRRLSLTVRATERTPALDPLSLGQVTLARSVYDRAFSERRDRLILAAAEPGALGAIQRALAPFPDAELSTRGAFVSTQAKSVDAIVAIFMLLLVLTVVVSVLGIVNTSALSVLERTREIGLLRTVGMSRRQVGRMVRSEGVITAVIGVVLGIGLGVALAALVTTALSDVGMRFALPVLTLAGFVVMAANSGRAAAAGPARRAGRLDVLTALAHD